MTNEELACAVQQGDANALSQLWEQVKDYAYAVVKHYTPKPYADTEDYLQTAFLGVRAAAMAFDPSRGGFLTVADWYIRRACSVFYRWYRRGEVQTISYDVPYNPEDPDDGDYKDLFPDESLLEPWEAMEQDDLVRDVRAAVDDLTPRWREVIEQRYYQGKPMDAVSRIQGVSHARIGQIEQRALKQLQRSKHLVPYARLYAPHRGVGVGAFLRYGSSIVEHVAIKNADMALEAERRRQRQELLKFQRRVQRHVEAGVYTAEIGQIIVENYKAQHGIA